MATERPAGQKSDAVGTPVGPAEVLPDGREEELAEVIDNIVPTHGYAMAPLVGLGGSAGSIGALLSFFERAPDRSGLAFAVVIHLSPEHESSLPQLLSRATRMPVLTADDGQEIRPDHVYVIPPGKLLLTNRGRLATIPLERETGRRNAVDVFFRAMADTHGPHARAVVLSGMDGDGAIGVKRVKERGGLTIAQDPNEAEHPDMPRSAIATGMVDWVLTVQEMPRRLLEYQRRESTVQLPPEEAPATTAPAPESAERETQLLEVLNFLRSRTGCDFNCYKRATILRRIARRLQVTGVDDLAGYLALLRTTPGEAGALLKDLLISVTNFFRDREAFAALEARIPDLFAGKSQGDAVRVWVPACATGEEVYSIAMLLLEHARRLDFPPAIQVFGCDLDDDAIDVARAGLYPLALTADVSEARLRRFFTKEHQGYRVRRELREMVLFAVHDLLKDAPFSRMDLISCRNLLIYLNQQAQDRVLETFNFALRPQGLLFLGTSESVSDAGTLFRVLDKKHRLFAPRHVPGAGLPVSQAPARLMKLIEGQMRPGSSPVLPGPGFATRPTGTAPVAGEPERASWAEIHFRLIDRFAPPSVVVNGENEIRHLSESASRFLRLRGGEPTANLLQLVHPLLRVELRTLLFRAAQTGEPAEVQGIRLEAGGDARMEVDIRVAPAADLAPDLLLVVFTPRRVSDRTPGESAAPAEPMVPHLERELEQMKLRLRDTVEQFDASNEEMKASNEELQAMNEELRSATEELETSREELQSINEELTTVNAELKSKVDELANTNGDLQNLMASTAIATVFVDRELRITRFTPSAAPIFHLIPGDVGRPLSDLRHQLEYADLKSDAQRVLSHLVPVEREVNESSGRSFLARLLPYRTPEDRIAGVVLNFLDITERRQAVEALRASEERLRLLIESARDFAIFTLDLERRVSTWNAGAQAMCGYSEAEIVGKSGDILFTPEDRARGAPEREARTALEEGSAANERWHIRQDKSLFWGSGSVRPMRDSAGRVHGFVKIMRDLTESIQAEEALRAHMDELTRFNRATQGRELRMVELKREVNSLLARMGEPIRYPAAETEPPSSIVPS